MLRIAICDDDKIYLDIITVYITQLLNNTEVRIKKYLNPNALIKDLQVISFDILFLDIDMPIKSGFDVSEEIRKNISQPYIVFISAKKELVYKSFEYNPFYFICKNDQTDFYQQLNHVVKKLMLHFHRYKKLTIKDTLQGETIVCQKDILYIRSEKHYLYYFIQNRNDPFLERSTITEKLVELNCPDMLRPHQRYLVNMIHIKRFGDVCSSILLNNNEEIPVSKSYRQKAIQDFMNFNRR